MIILIIGPMFSEKTTEMIRLVNRERIAGKKVVIVRSNKDNRDFLTHSGIDTDIQEAFVDELKDLLHAESYDVIGIDEGQFMPNLARDANELSDIGKTIIISALNGTSEREPFDSIQELIPYVEVIDKKNAVCIDCGSQFATFSYYKAGNKKDKVKTGGSSDYDALCRFCYNKRMEEKHAPEKRPS